MIKSLTRVFLAILTGVLFSAAVPAQDSWMGDVRDQYVISAKAGVVNFVEGTVTVAGIDGTSRHLLKRDQLEAGERVTTGSDGKAEILLNPGSYARLGSGSSFEFKTTSLDDLEINLGSGSAIFEVFASKDFKVTINAPKAKMFLIQSGIYRVDVLPDGGGRISVTKGRAQLDDAARAIVKSGGQATLNDRVSQLAKFDSDDKDQLDTWSKARARELARISRRVDEARMRNSLLNSFRLGRWDMFSSFGLWAYDASYGSYSFMPFGWGWNSPYGYGFGPCIYTYNLPPKVYWPPPYVPGNGNGSGSGSGSHTNTPIANNPREAGGIRPPLSVLPPFAQIQSDPKSGGSITNGGRPIIDTPYRDINTGNNGGQTYSPPPPPSPAVFIPSPSRSDTKPKDN